MDQSNETIFKGLNSICAIRLAILLIAEFLLVDVWYGFQRIFHYLSIIMCNCAC